MHMFTTKNVKNVNLTSFNGKNITKWSVGIVILIYHLPNVGSWSLNVSQEVVKLSQKVSFDNDALP